MCTITYFNLPTTCYSVVFSWAQVMPPPGLDGYAPPPGLELPRRKVGAFRNMWWKTMENTSRRS